MKRLATASSYSGGGDTEGPKKYLWVTPWFDQQDPQKGPQAFSIHEYARAAELFREDYSPPNMKYLTADVLTVAHPAFDKENLEGCLKLRLPEDHQAFIVLRDSRKENNGMGVLLEKTPNSQHYRLAYQMEGLLRAMKLLPHWGDVSYVFFDRPRTSSEPA